MHRRSHSTRLFIVCFLSPCYQLWYSLTATSRGKTRVNHNYFWNRKYHLKIWWTTESSSDNFIPVWLFCSIALRCKAHRASPKLTGWFTSYHNWPLRGTPLILCIKICLQVSGRTTTCMEKVMYSLLWLWRKQHDVTWDSVLWVWGIDSINSGRSFQVWQVKPMRKCLQPPLFLMACTGF